MLDESIIKLINNELTTANSEELMPLFCLLDFASRPAREFEESLLNCFKKLSTDDQKVAWLGICQKHFIERMSRDGDPIPKDFIKSLRTLLTDERRQSWEVLEWVLRTVVMIGPMSVELKSEIEAIRPKVLSIFNSHQRQFFEILNLLQSQWARRKN